MSERTDHGVDSQIDRALRAMVDDGHAVDLHARVLGAIEARPFMGRAGRGRWPAFRAVHLFPRPALGVALAAGLAVAVLALWPAGGPAPQPPGSSRGSMTRPAPPANRAAVGSHTLNQSAAVASARDGRDAVSPARNTTTHRRRARAAEPWSGALPPLEPLTPLELEPIGEPLMRMAHLEVEGLSITPLEVDALDGSEEE